MIQSIGFDNEYKDGYIWEHMYSYKRGKKSKFARGGYEQIEIDNGLKNPQLVNNLIGRKFEFVSDKINVLFGPNGSGKSTIIKTIAAYCMCGQGGRCGGMTSFQCYEPLDYAFRIGEERFNQEELDKAIVKKAKNKAKVEWDGNPVYFHNFTGNIVSFDDLMGSIVDDGGTSSIEYLMNKDKISYGQHSIFILNQITKRIKDASMCDDFIGSMEDTLNKMRGNDCWKNCFTNNIEYIKNHYTNKTVPTVLLDEIDKSLDIVNTISLYKDYLPKVMKNLKCQIVLVTHSPFVLMNDKKTNNMYNIISLDEEYTKKVREKLESLKF